MLRETRGAYIARLDLAQPHLLGVAGKIKAQISALSSAAEEMALYTIEDGAIVRDGQCMKRSGGSSVAKRLTYYVLFYLYLAKHPIDTDFVYIRYQRSSPLFLYMLSRLKAHNPNLLVLVELPSYPFHTEWVSLREKILGLVDRVSRPFLHHFVDRIVTFSQEHEILGIPTIRTDNGVEPEQLTLSEPPSAINPFNLVGVANLSNWHGYDRVIMGLTDYYRSGGKHDIRFDIVGTGQSLAALQSLVLQHQLSGRVVFHGPKHGAALDAIINRSHMGVSSIGMHRIKVDTSNLKSREYCARGIPFIIAYEDRDFPTTLPFAFHAPASDEPIDVQAILDFYMKLHNRYPAFPSDMRKYAEDNLSWRAKLMPVINAIMKFNQMRKNNRSSQSWN